MMLGLAAIIVAAVPAPATAALGGIYEIHQMEMGGGLELKSDGHFFYALSYGAIDEEGGGDWTFDGKAVHLTSNPMPTAPSFEFVKDEPAPKGELYLTLEDPGFEWGHSLEAIATADMKSGFEVTPDDNGRVDLAGKSDIMAVAPLMPVYGPTGQIFQLKRDQGHRLLFRFHKNDLGKPIFHDEVLSLGAGGLEMRRYETLIRFVRVRP